MFTVLAAPNTKSESRPVIQYDARYVTVNLGKGVVAFFDTVEGILNTALVSKTGFDTWRVYDVKKIADKKGKTKIEIDKIFQNKKIHRRYKLNLINGKLTITDTLTGRVWTCRHSNGICDIWKVYDFKKE
jgi:CRISPR/Cas system-associated endonuclease Cas3-HD